MVFDAPSSTKRSIGFLRKAPIKTKDRSPDYIGTLKLQRHTMEVFSQQFQDTNTNEIECCLASWRNIDANGQAYASVELSPKYIARSHRQEPNDTNDLAEFI
jgi:hypothetical protein